MRTGLFFTIGLAVLCVLLEAGFAADVAGKSKLVQSPQGGGKLAVLRSQFEAALTKIRETGLKEQKTVLNSYVEILSKRKTKLQATGDLDRVVKFKEEIEKVMSGGGVTASQDPELDEARQTYLDMRAAMDKGEKEKIAELNAAYATRLQALETELTIGGAIDEALAVRKERDRIQGGAETILTTPGAPVATTQKITAARSPGDAALLEGKPSLSGEILLPAGVYRPKHPVQLGIRDKKSASPYKPVEIANVVSVPGTLIEAGEIFIENRSIWKSGGTLFKGTQIGLAFGGKFEAKESLFEHCDLRKGDGGNINQFSCKWTFENCVRR